MREGAPREERTPGATGRTLWIAGPLPGFADPDPLPRHAGATGRYATRSTRRSHENSVLQRAYRPRDLNLQPAFTPTLLSRPLTCLVFSAPGRQGGPLLRCSHLVPRARLDRTPLSALDCDPGAVRSWGSRLDSNPSMNRGVVLNTFEYHFEYHFPRLRRNGWIVRVTPVRRIGDIRNGGLRPETTVSGLHTVEVAGSIPAAPTGNPACW
jgi:hypothetical protein